jgi:hypothetical protein
MAINRLLWQTVPSVGACARSTCRKIVKQLFAHREPCLGFHLFLRQLFDELRESISFSLGACRRGEDFNIKNHIWSQNWALISANAVQIGMFHG